MTQQSNTKSCPKTISAKNLNRDVGCAMLLVMDVSASHGVGSGGAAWLRGERRAAAIRVSAALGVFATLVGAGRPESQGQEVLRWGLTSSSVTVALLLSAFVFLWLDAGRRGQFFPLLSALVDAMLGAAYALFCILSPESTQGGLADGSPVCLILLATAVAGLRAAPPIVRGAIALNGVSLSAIVAVDAHISGWRGPAELMTLLFFFTAAAVLALSIAALERSRDHDHDTTASDARRHEMRSVVTSAMLNSDMLTRKVHSEATPGPDTLELAQHVKRDLRDLMELLKRA